MTEPLTEESRPRRAILIDLDGVVRIWPGSPWLEPGTEKDSVDHLLRSIAFGPDLLHQVITGRIDDPAWRVEIERRLLVDRPDHAADAVAAWSASLPVIDARVRDLILGWRRIVPVVAVTNATSRLSADQEALGISGLFDVTINSSEVGHAKPAARIFRVALERVGVEPDGAIFIDDSAANVQAAIDLGLTGHHYTGSLDELARVVRDWLARDPVAVSKHGKP
ncbi:MAG TPA: HAD-IA family hydrolase [Thermomicrobiales bacterium]|jgi:putative hydrolase of the HAD superfamily|nr:HAD-IA family hydrolase [Thermomicrobiales bacterium]